MRVSRDRVCEILSPEFIDDLRSAVGAAVSDGWASEEFAEKINARLFEVGSLCHGDDWFMSIGDRSAVHIWMDIGRRSGLLRPSPSWGV